VFLKGGQQMSDKIIEVEERLSGRSLRDLYYVFFRHKWKVLLFFLAVIVIVAISTFVSDNIYRSEAKLLVRVGRETVTLDPTATTGTIIPVAQSRESEIGTELEILKSREIAEKVVDSLGVEAFTASPGGQRKSGLLERLSLTTPLSDRDIAVQGILDNLQVEVQKESWILGISYEAKEPKLAQDVLSKFIDCYLEKHIDVHRTPGSYQFFIQESEHLRKNLVETDNQLRDLMNQTGISSLDEQRSAILGRISTLQVEIDSTESDLAASRAKAQELQTTLTNTPDLVVTGATVGLPNAAADSMRSKLYELQLQEQDLVSRFEQDSRQVQDVRRQIAAAQVLLDQENQARSTLTKGLNATYQGVQSAMLAEQAIVSSLQAKVSELKNKLELTRVELKTLNDNSAKITTLTREMEIQEANYRKYSENLEQARVDDAMETRKISNINVVQLATLPVKPVRPNRSLNLLLGLLLGIFGGIAIAFLSEYLDHSIKTPDEVERKLQLPAIACIPRFAAGRISPASKWDIPQQVKEYYEAFKERVLLYPGGSKRIQRVLAITGSHHNEGASSVAANLARALARPGDGQVLLVDANFQHPSIHQIFESRLSPGLSDILTNGQNIDGVVVPSPVQNLHILSAGTINGDLSEIFDSEKFTSLLDSIKKDYRYVVIDLPAVNEASWALRLARLCDGVGLVVEAERSRWEVAQRTKELLEQSKAKIIGVIINKRRFYIPRWLYQTL
jgi:capsular exopolysaccharide synthesis family protein